MHLDTLKKTYTTQQKTDPFEFGVPLPFLPPLRGLGSLAPTARLKPFAASRLAALPADGWIESARRTGRDMRLPGEGHG